MTRIGQFPVNRRVTDTVTARREKIKRCGSPYFTLTPAAIAAGSYQAWNIAQSIPAAQKYEPLDWIEIVNNDQVDLTISLDGGDTFKVVKKTIRTISEKRFRYIKLTNDDAVLASTEGSIVITVRREPMTVDKWVRHDY